MIILDVNFFDTRRARNRHEGYRFRMVRWQDRFQEWHFSNDAYVGTRCNADKG